MHAGEGLQQGEEDTMGDPCASSREQGRPAGGGEGVCGEVSSAFAEPGKGKEMAGGVWDGSRE
jgi:hypothetical protein